MVYHIMDHIVDDRTVWPILADSTDVSNAAQSIKVFVRPFLAMQCALPYTIVIWVKRNLLK